MAASTIYDLGQYSTQTLNTFEYIGSNVVSRFWSRFYEDAKIDHQSGRAVSITEAYKTRCRQYLRLLDDPIKYREVLSGLHEHFRGSYPGLSFTQMIDMIIKEIIPPETLPAFTDPQKDTVLASAIRGSINSFAIWAMSSTGLRHIIDRPTAPADIKVVISILQDNMLRCLLEQRADCYSKVATSLNKRVSTVDIKVREEVKTLMATVATLREKLKKAVNIIETEEKKSTYLMRRAQEEAKAGMELRVEVAALKRQLAESRQSGGAMTPSPPSTVVTPVPAPPTAPAPVHATPATPAKKPDISAIASNARAAKKAPVKDDIDELLSGSFDFSNDTLFD